MAKKRREDANQSAFRTLQEATGDSPKTPAVEPPDPKKNPAAVELGRLGGLKGGKSRAEKLSPEERKAIAKKASNTRWKSQ